MSRLTFGYFKLLWKKILLFLLSLLSLSIISVSTSRASDLEESLEKLKNHVSGGVIILFRNELWSTFTQRGVPTNRTYDFLFVRGRGFIDFSWNKFTLHFMGQGVQAFNLPRKAAFGLGRFILTPRNNKPTPGIFQFVEAYLQAQDIYGFYLKGGRIGYNDGAQVLYTDDPKLNWVIQARLSERLI